jgi:hypothetical protein
LRGRPGDRHILFSPYHRDSLSRCRPIAVSPRHPVSPSPRLSPLAGNKKTCHGIYQAGVFVIEVSLKGEF